VIVSLPIYVWMARVPNRDGLRLAAA